MQGLQSFRGLSLTPTGNCQKEYYGQLAGGLGKSLLKLCKPRMEDLLSLLEVKMPNKTCCPPPVATLAVAMGRHATPPEISQPPSETTGFAWAGCCGSADVHRVQEKTRALLGRIVLAVEEND